MSSGPFPSGRPDVAMCMCRGNERRRSEPRKNVARKRYSLEVVIYYITIYILLYEVATGIHWAYCWNGRSESRLGDWTILAWCFHRSIDRGH